jgi:hypothetical protein
MIKCNKKSVLPNIAPVIYSLSVNSSISKTYCSVIISGDNFNQSYVNFGSFKLPVTYFGSNNISFLIPLEASSGTYYITVVNIFNGFTSINCSSFGKEVYSNAVSFTVI